MRNVVLNHISSIGCCNPLGQTNLMLDSTTMLENGNFGFPYSFLPRFPPLPSGATISTPAISTPAFLMLPLFPLPRFQSPLNYFNKFHFHYDVRRRECDRAEYTRDTDRTIMKQVNTAVDSTEQYTTY